MDKALLSKLQTQCARREYCSQDILRKAVKALDGDVRGAEEIVAALESEKYVDDFRYASAYAREKACISGWGPEKIMHTLCVKGIRSETAREAMAEIDAEEAESKMRKVLDAKYRTLKDDPEWKLKLIRFALGRGYRYDSVCDFLSEL